MRRLKHIVIEGARTDLEALTNGLELRGFERSDGEPRWTRRWRSERAWDIATILSVIAEEANVRLPVVQSSVVLL